MLLSRSVGFSDKLGSAETGLDDTGENLEFTWEVSMLSRAELVDKEVLRRELKQAQK